MATMPVYNPATGIKRHVTGIESVLTIQHGLHNHTIQV